MMFQTYNRTIDYYFLTICPLNDERKRDTISLKEIATWLILPVAYACLKD